MSVWRSIILTTAGTWNDKEKRKPAEKVRILALSPP